MFFMYIFAFEKIGLCKRHTSADNKQFKNMQIDFFIRA